MSTETGILAAPVVSRIRRNHGLEHATLNVLSKKIPHTNMAGYSDIHGFWVVGDIPTEMLQEAIEEALDRMRNGESDLAIHANCGTNFVASGIVAGLAAWVSLLGTRRLRERVERLPMVISLVTLALVASQPLGLFLQAHVTTSGLPGELEVVEIIVSHRSGMPAHRVLTRG
jgi:hypothetical protein